MSRVLLAALALAGVPLVGPACSLPKPLSLFQRVVYADATLLGTVTAVEKDEVETPNHHPSLPPLSYKVAVVKVDRAVFAAPNTTHVKVLFTGDALRPGQKLWLFLTRHPDLTGCHLPAGQSPWLDATDEKHADQVKALEALLPVVGNPQEALRSKDADDRARAAVLLAIRYRHTPPGTKEADLDAEPVPLAESQLILRALGELDWDKETDGIPNAAPYQRLGLTKNNGGFLHAAALQYPDMMKKHFPGGKNELRAAFNTWRAGDGSKYQIRKLTPKAK